MPYTPPQPVSEVVVHADRLPDPAGEAAFSVATLDPQQLRDRRTLDQALETIPGFSLYRRTSTLGANPTTQGVSLRAIAGSGASRALVTLDGAPQNDPFGGWVIWTALPPGSIGDARVVRGAAAGPYGAGALTGVVQLDSRADLDGAEVGASGGELDYRQADVTVGAKVAGARLLLGGATEGSSGWIPVRDGCGLADRPVGLQAWSASARAERAAGAATVVARVAAYEEDRGAGQVGAASRASGAQVSLGAAMQPSPSALGWRVQAWATASDLYNSTASISPDRNGSTPADLQYGTPAIGWGLNAAVRKLAGPISLEAGADVRAAAGESRELYAYSGGVFTRMRTAGGGARVGGLYVETSTRTGRWLLTGGARLDDWANYAAKRIERATATGTLLLNDRPADHSSILPTGRFGARRSLRWGLAWRAAAYAGFRPPTLNELHRPFRVGANVTEANPTLAPERLYGFDSGVDLASGALTASATLFRNRLADAITNVTVGQGPAVFPIAGYVAAGGTLRMRENAGAVDATGLEVESRAAFPSGAGDLHGALAWTDSTVEGGARAPQLDGKRPALTPRFTATAGVRWRATPACAVSLDGRYESARYDDDLNTLRLGRALTADLRLDWTVHQNVAVFIAADNLFDAAVRTAETATGVYSYDVPRVLRVGLRLAVR